MAKLLDGPFKIADASRGAVRNRLARLSPADAQGALLILFKLMAQPIAFAATPQNMFFELTLISIVVIHR